MLPIFCQGYGPAHPDLSSRAAAADLLPNIALMNGTSTCLCWICWHMWAEGSHCWSGLRVLIAGVADTCICCWSSRTLQVCCAVLVQCLGFATSAKAGCTFSAAATPGQVNCKTSNEQDCYSSAEQYTFKGARCGERYRGHTFSALDTSG